MSIAQAKGQEHVPGEPCCLPTAHLRVVKQESHSPGERGSRGLRATNKKVHHRHMHVPLVELPWVSGISLLLHTLEHVVNHVFPLPCHQAVLQRQGKLGVELGEGPLPSSDRGGGWGRQALDEARGASVLTLCLFSCCITIWSLLSWNCFSFQRPGLGKNWGRKGSQPQDGDPVGSPPSPLPRNPGESGLQLLTLRKGIISKIWMDQ